MEEETSSGPSPEPSSRRRPSLKDLPDSLFEPVIDLPAPVAAKISSERRNPMPEPGDPTGQLVEGELLAEPDDQPPAEPQVVLPRRPAPTQPMPGQSLSYQPRVVQEVEPPLTRHARRPRRSAKTALLISCTVFAALLLAGLMFLLIYPSSQGQPQPTPGPTGTGQGPDRAHLAALHRQAADLLAQWRKMKLNPAYRSLSDRFAAIDAAMSRTQQAMQAADAVALEQAMSAMRKAIDDLVEAHEQALAEQRQQETQAQRLAQLKAQAQELADQVRQARDLAGQGGADRLLPDLWEKLQTDQAQVEQDMRQGRYEQAIAGWQKMLERYGRLQEELAAAEQAHRRRQELLDRLEEHFQTDQFKRYAPQAWQAVEALLARADVLLEEHRYEQAIEHYGQVMGLIEPMEQQVRRLVGTKVHALHMGYLTTDTMLEAAAGTVLTEDHYNRLRRVYEQLALSQDLLGDLPSDPSPAYEKVALYLAVKGRSTLEHERGKAVADCFAVGFHLRMLKRMLKPGVDADQLTSTALAESRRLALLLQREAAMAGCSPALLSALKGLAQALPAKGDDLPAIDRCQEMLDQLVEKLMNFDTALKLVGPYQPPAGVPPVPAPPASPPATPSSPATDGQAPPSENEESTDLPPL